MSKARRGGGKRRASAQRIVAPGSVGAEDYVDALAADGLNFTGIASTRKDAVDRLVAAQALRMGRNASDSDLERLLALYTTSLWINVCVGQIANAMAATPLVAEFRRKASAKWEPRTDSDVQAVIDAPAGPLTPYEVVERASTFMECCGSELLMASTKNADPGDPKSPIVGFHPLRPSNVWIVPGGEFVEIYQYWVNGQYVDIDPANAQLMRYCHPLSDYWGLSPASTIIKTTEVDAALETYNKRALDAGGHPDVVLESDQNIGRGEARRMRTAFEQEYMRPDRNGGAIVLEKGLKAKPLGLPPKDMQFTDMSRETRRRILAAYGVPPAVGMDFTEASVLANADAQVKLFIRQTVRSKARRLAWAMTRLIQSRWGPYWRVRFDFDQVDVLKDPKEDRAGTLAEYQGGVVTLNEARAKLGYDPTADGDQFRQSAPAPTAFGGGDQTMPSPKAAPSAHPRRVTTALKAAARSAYRRSTQVWLPQLRGKMRGFFRDQRDRVLASLRENFNRVPHPLTHAAAAPAGVAKGVSDQFDETLLNAIFGTTEEAAKFRAEVGPVFLLGLVDAANEKVDELAPDAKLALSESHFGIRSFYEGWGATRVVDIQDTTREAIKEALQYSFEQGYSMREVEQAITAKFEDLVHGGDGDPALESEFPEYRLERIARTETATMLNAGQFEGTKALVASGANVVKSWLSARDNLVRDSHAQVDAETSDAPIPFGQAFSNGLQYPNDPSGDASENVNCRCTLIEQVVEEPT